MFSQYQTEEEVLLEPNRKFVVTGNASTLTVLVRARAHQNRAVLAPLFIGCNVAANSFIFQMSFMRSSGCLFETAFRGKTVYKQFL